MKKLVSAILTLVMLFALCPRGFAMEEPLDSVTFSGLSQLAAGEQMERQVTDAAGNTAVVGIEKVQRNARAGGETWQVWYKGLNADVEFYMTVSNNRVTSVYDYSISLVGSTYEDADLSMTSTYGKLTFKHVAILGLSSSTCWLKGTVTGENDEIVVDWQM